MKYSNRWRFSLALACLVALEAMTGCTAVEESNIRKNLTMKFIPASDSRFAYEGRFDFSVPGGPVVIWTGSRVSLDFEGKSLALCFAGAQGQNFFSLRLDDAPVTIISVGATGPQRIEIPVPTKARRHQLTLFKRSEAAVGQVQFGGIEIDGNAEVWAPVRPRYQGRMEFFGDSIMVGACNEDGAVDQWEDHRTHNNALSYTALTAAAFNADYRCMAVSGMGIATGYVEVKAGEVWNRLYPVAGSTFADLKTWQPAVALINFGENDDSFSRAHQQPFPAGYATGYVALVKAMREAYPRTQLVLLRGGMWGGSQSPALRDAWESVVKEVEAADPAISHYVFAHWSANHPRVSDDRAMAEELIAWLKTQAFMQSWQ